MLKDAKEGLEDANEALDLYIATNETFSEQAELRKKASELVVLGINKETDALRKGNEETEIGFLIARAK